MSRFGAGAMTGATERSSIFLYFGRMVMILKNRSRGVITQLPDHPAPDPRKKVAFRAGPEVFNTLLNPLDNK